jgi:hypothetical protein
MTIHKSNIINELVDEMTSNKALQTFYKQYLIAEKEEEKQQLNQDFKRTWQSLNADDLAILKREFTDGFRQLLPIAKGLRNEVNCFSS